MKTTTILLLLTLFTIRCFAQSPYEKGYLIHNDGEVVHCYIKNSDWKNNPTEIKYKFTENSETKMAGLSNTQAFGIANKMAYVRAVVPIDYSSGEVTALSYQRAPEFKTDTVFLKTLVKGEASLYYYENRNLIRYFYRVAEGPIEPLIYKEYINGDKGVFKNRDFTAQLWQHVRCSSASVNTMKTMRYRANDLVSYFRDYNRCVNKGFTDFTSSQKKKMFSLILTPGIERASMSIDSRETNLVDVDFGSRFNYRAGLEINLKLPFNHNQWSIFIEPTYQHFSGHKVIERAYYLPRDVDVD